MSSRLLTLLVPALVLIGLVLFGGPSPKTVAIASAGGEWDILGSVDVQQDPWGSRDESSAGYEPCEMVAVTLPSQVVKVGASATFVVHIIKATDCSPITHYEWQKNGVAIPNAPDDCVFVIDQVEPCDQGSYRCVLTLASDSPQVAAPARLEISSDGPPPAPPAAARSSGIPAVDEATTSIDHASGEFVVSAVDLRVPGRGIDFVWQRTYRSRGYSAGLTHGWDHSYNIRIERAPDEWTQCNQSSSSTDLILYSGNGRRDSFELKGDKYAAEEWFITGQDDGSGAITFTFPNKSLWVFHTLAGSLPHKGKIQEIVDRNGNRLSFEYDSLGRLALIRDTLEREFAITYNQLGLIEYVSDNPRESGGGRIGQLPGFQQRSVKYSYYRSGEPGGSPNDLKAVRSPVVLDTPNGNDYPNGRTTTYTYTRGFSDEELNHNLLTITDAEGQEFLRNEYSSTVDPGRIDYDRLSSQTLGEPGDIIGLAYACIAPNAGNNFSSLVAIENDRVGNVRENYYGNRNLLVMQREYTGRADPDLPTDLTNNRPTGPLRGTDPAFFETRFQYNEDSLVKRIVYPEGNSVEYDYEGDSAGFVHWQEYPNVPQRQEHANVVAMRRLPDASRGGDQAVIERRFTYLPGFGGREFVTREFDGRGGQVVQSYDAVGNRVTKVHELGWVKESFTYNGHGQLTTHTLPTNGVQGSGNRRVDEYRYYPPGDHRYGYLASVTVDALGEALQTAYDYDTFGNVVQVVDPLGRAQTKHVNQLNEVVRETARDGTEKDYYYDANGNIVRTDVQNKDEAGDLRSNSHHTTLNAYDVLGRVTRILQEVEEGDFAETRFEYDANRNRILVRYGEASSGRDPNNEVATEYDERDLVFRTIRAPGDAGLRSVTRHDYDRNGNETVRVEGDDDSNTTPREFHAVYDGFDRVVAELDPMGNMSTYHYDPNGNLGGERSPGVPNPFGLRVEGELVDVPGSSGNVVLSEVHYGYDAMNRRIHDQILFFDDGGAVGDGKAETLRLYSGTSQLLAVTDDNGHTTTFEYDTVNRLLSTTDAGGNAKVIGVADASGTITGPGYDANSNIIAETELEKSDLDGSRQAFVTTYSYDVMDRRTSTTDSLGHSWLVLHDSAGSPSLEVDPLGKESRFRHDGLGRLVVRVRDLDGDGARENDIDDIVTTQEWDDSSRLVARIDPHGNRTEYEFDALDRAVAVVFGDGTSERVQEYDVLGNSIVVLDANGSQVSSEFDLLNRVTRRDVVPGQDVVETCRGLPECPDVSDDTTFELYGYDGLSRIVRAEDDDSVVVRRYDSLSRVAEESIDGGSCTFVYDGMGNRLVHVYPSGRVVEWVYDSLGRKRLVCSQVDGGGSSCAPGGEIASFDYAGPTRVQRRRQANGAVESIWTFDGARRITATQHVVDPQGAGTVLDHRTYSWDEVSNKLSHSDLVYGTATLAYSYDAANRLISATDGVGWLDYELDECGNRSPVYCHASMTNAIPNGSQVPTDVYHLEAKLQLVQDCQVNQYTRTPFDARQYDMAGNMVVLEPAALPGLAIAFDYRNRLVAYTDGSGTLTTYAYDAFGRRIRKVLDANGSAETTVFFYDGWQVVEEQDELGATQATYVHGVRRGEILSMRRDPDGQGAQDFFFLGDDLESVRAVVDAAGALHERYEYPLGDVTDPGGFGRVQIMDGGGTPIPVSAIGNPHSFVGLWRDQESGFYVGGTRYLDPRAGRYLSRDPLGPWVDAADLGNGTTFANNNPTSRAD